MACGRISGKITVTIRYVFKNIAPHGHKFKSCINDTNAYGHGIDWRVIWCRVNGKTPIKRVSREVLV